jgi:hypothetical protein
MAVTLELVLVMAVTLELVLVMAVPLELVLFLVYYPPCSVGSVSGIDILDSAMNE